MSLGSDFKILYHMIFRHGSGKSHAERLDSFYSGQASGYDDFRKRFLIGRSEMMHAAAQNAGKDLIWVDMGGGTGANLENIRDLIPELKKVYVVDLASSLLKVTNDRIEKNGWTNVEAVEADATKFTPAEGYADIVTFSYSLTMIPDWYAALENAMRILRPGGTLGVVDFFVSRKWPDEGHQKHSWFTRSYWPVHFSTDNVFLCKDHLPYLQQHFETVQCDESWLKVPYIPIFRVPYYIFIGKKTETSLETEA
ncbi:MAG: class I SAM-dependent methyltransferase [Planctomycetia bacterium]|nr:class I SAM-dependent methyltransferase [Planctomycetia bacterium]